MKWTIRLIKGFSFLCIMAFSPINAQNNCDTNCSIQCIGQINVSLDQNCSTEITPAMGAVGVEYYCNSYYSVSLYDEYGTLLPNAFVGIEYHDKLLTYKVTENTCGNSCWGKVFIEYKYPPLIECPGDLTLTCGAAQLLAVPPASGGCADFDVVLHEQIKQDLNCDDEYSSIITRTYRAYDSYGNTSYCSHDIYIRRLNVENIVFPGPAVISCTDTLMRFDSNGIPIPWYTIPLSGSGMGDGIPIICDPEITDGLYCPLNDDLSGVPLIPNSGGIAIIENPDIYGPKYIVEHVGETNSAAICNAILTYTDMEIPNVACKRMILRQWNILEWWCYGELSQGAAQLITIIDDEAPSFICPSDFTVSTDSDCGGNVYLQPIEAYDECAGNIDVMVQHSNGTLHSNGGYVDLNLGHNQLTYIVSDGCYNQSTCNVEVTVEDRRAPVTICETYKVISISTSAHTLVFAEPFDNGSWDECGLDRFEVRRMDSLCVAADTLFDASVNFCCSDVGNEVMVVFRAYDWNGNYNDCMVTVEVQDKIAPSIQCPPDRTIQCQDGYDINNLSLTFGEAIITDNCSNTQIVKETPVSDVNQCGVGTITRFIDIVDTDSFTIAHCKQLISIENYQPFVGANIQWPLDYITEVVCDVSSVDPQDLPEFYNFPSFGFHDECTLLGYQYEDKRFESGNGCVHIKRTWRVINWCGSSNGEFDIWTNPEPQIIEIINTTAPVIDDQEDLQFESQDVNCEGDSIQVIRTASDDCEFLGWYHTVRNESGDTIRNGLSDTLTMYLPVGTYTVEWVVRDGCGNFDVDFQQLTMINTKAPTPVCINGLSVSLVAMDLDTNGILDAEIVELWASDFDIGSTYSCGNPIVLSLSSDINIKNITFDCDDIGRNEVRLYATDVVTGYQDFCVSFVDVQDNNSIDICSDTLGRSTLSGEIYTEELELISDVKISIGDNLPIEVTDTYGQYAFEDMPLGGNYEVMPEKDDDYLNGVTTLDLILVQRHILGMESLISPYKLLAADINNDGNISSTDLIELRKLILGIYDDLPYNKSWRFVDSEYQFIDSWNPWINVFPESHVIDNLSSDMKIDFVGLKVGDVNATAAASNSIGSSGANLVSKSLDLIFEESSIEQGTILSIPIYGKGYNEILGWQLALQNDPSIGKVIEIVPGSVGLNIDEHINFAKSNAGEIKISFSNTEALTYNEDEVLFEIVFEAYRKTNVNELFSVSGFETMNSEAYNNDMEVIGINILGKKSKMEKASILSVAPNPWSDFAALNYELPIAGKVNFQFFDMSGSLLMQQEFDRSSGKHVYKIRKEMLDAKGMIYVRMTTEYSSSEFKMVIIE